jgi:hypothetical protein
MERVNASSTSSGYVRLEGRHATLTTSSGVQARMENRNEHGSAGGNLIAVEGGDPINVALPRFTTPRSPKRIRSKPA